jgi:hypothetical protein
MFSAANDMMNTVSICPYCAETFEPHHGRGRPRRFCTAACKRLAESALRRLTRRLERLDDDASRWERHTLGVGFSGSRTYAERTLGCIRHERAAVLAEYEAAVRSFEPDDSTSEAQLS